MSVWSIDDDVHKFQQIRDSEYCFFCQKHKSNPIHDTSKIQGLNPTEDKDGEDSKAV